jgi:Flp pilus assembly protein TadD
MAAQREQTDFNLLDWAADARGRGAPRALGRRLPALVAELLRAAGVPARHGSATVPLPPGDGDSEPTGVGWAVAAGLLEEGEAIAVSRRLGPTRFLAHGQLAPAGRAGLTLKLRVLRRGDGAEALRLERDFFEEEALDAARRVALELAGLVGAREAVAAVDAAAVAGTESAEALLLLFEGEDGLAALAGGLAGANVAGALARVVAAVERDPGCARARDLALAAIAAGAASEGRTPDRLDLDAALSLCGRLASARPADAGAALLFARLLRRRGRPRDARSALAEARRAAPRSAPLALELARCHAALEELDAGLALCAAALADGAVDATEAERAALHAEHGLALARAGHLDDAVAALEAALELDADQPPALANLARCRALRGDHEAARRLYDRALALDPTAWEVAKSSAALLLESGALEDAAVRLRLWADERPDDPEAALACAETLVHLGLADEALARLAAATERHDDPRLLALLGGVLTQVGRLDDAEARYRAALRLAPDDAALLSNLAVLLSTRGDAVEAERLATRAVAIAPQDPVSARVLDHVHRLPRA